MREQRKRLATSFISYQKNLQSDTCCRFWRFYNFYKFKLDGNVHFFKQDIIEKIVRKDLSQKIPLKAL